MQSVRQSAIHVRSLTNQVRTSVRPQFPNFKFPFSIFNYIPLQNKRERTPLPESAKTSFLNQKNQKL